MKYSLLLFVSILAVNFLNFDAKKAHAQSASDVLGILGTVGTIIVQETISNQITTRPGAIEPPANGENFDFTTRQIIQRRLNSLGFSVGTADGVFGPATRRGISQYQRSIGSPPTGFLTHNEVQVLIQTATRPTQSRESVPTITEIDTSTAADARQIARVQQLLNVLGYNVGTADGVVGNNTRRGISAFISSNQLSLDQDDFPSLLIALESATSSQGNEILNPEIATTNTITSETLGVSPANALDLFYLTLQDNTSAQEGSVGAAIVEFALSTGGMETSDECNRLEQALANEFRRGAIISAAETSLSERLQQLELNPYNRVYTTTVRRTLGTYDFEREGWSLSGLVGSIGSVPISSPDHRDNFCYPSQLGMVGYSGPPITIANPNLRRFNFVAGENEEIFFPVDPTTAEALVAEHGRHLPIRVVYQIEEMNSLSGDRAFSEDAPARPIEAYLLNPDSSAVISSYQFSVPTRSSDSLPEVITTAPGNAADLDMLGAEYNRDIQEAIWLQSQWEQSDEAERRQLLLSVGLTLLDRDRRLARQLNDDQRSISRAGNIVSQDLILSQWDAENPEFDLLLNVIAGQSSDLTFVGQILPEIAPGQRLLAIPFFFPPPFEDISSNELFVARNIDAVERWVTGLLDRLPNRYYMRFFARNAELDIFSGTFEADEPFIEERVRGDAQAISEISGFAASRLTWGPQLSDLVSENERTSSQYSCRSEQPRLQLPRGVCLSSRELFHGGGLNIDGELLTALTGFYISGDTPRHLVVPDYRVLHTQSPLNISIAEIPEGSIELFASELERHDALPVVLEFSVNQHLHGSLPDGDSYSILDIVPLQVFYLSRSDNIILQHLPTASIPAEDVETRPRKGPR